MCREKERPTLPPFASGKKTSRNNGNAWSASTLMGQLGSATCHVYKRLHQRIDEDHDSRDDCTTHPIRLSKEKRGVARILTWNLTLPNKTLAIRLACVNTPSTEAASPPCLRCRCHTTIQQQVFFPFFTLKFCCKTYRGKISSS